MGLGLGDMVGNNEDAATEFDYGAAFSRNLGLVSPAEQAQLASSKVAIAGLGGVGGAHLATLARMGIGAFHTADFDVFEIQNFNRQTGATVSNIGRPKTEVMTEIVAGINPSADVRCFPEGVNRENIDDFLDGVDVAIDGLDYFAVEAREMFYRETDIRRIPVVAAGPIGCSSALLVFVPGKMSWQDYFAMDLARSNVDKYILFAIGTAPRALQMSYLDRSYVDLEARKGPSLALAVQLCAGVVAAETLKLLLKRGSVLAAPFYQQFDAYRCRYAVGKLRWGNRGPIQRLKFALFRKMFVKPKHRCPIRPA